METYYTIYKVTNKVSGKFYIGSHKTKNLDDSYMGSGKYLKRAIEKHGIDNFEKEILFVFNNAEEMFAKEAEIVNEDFLATENTYNLKQGGFGGWDYENSNSDKQRQKCLKGNAKQKWLHENDKVWSTTVTNNRRIAGSNNLTAAHKAGKIKYDTFSGKSHSEKSKMKIGVANSEHQSGNKNSQYGTMWITNGVINKKIKKTDVIPDGFYKGRNTMVLVA